MLELFWLCFWRTWGETTNLENWILSTSLYVKLLDLFFCHNKLSAHNTDLELWRSEVG